MPNGKAFSWQLVGTQMLQPLRAMEAEAVGKWTVKPVSIVPVGEASRVRRGLLYISDCLIHWSWSMLAYVLRAIRVQFVAAKACRPELDVARFGSCLRRLVFNGTAQWRRIARSERNMTLFE